MNSIKTFLYTLNHLRQKTAFAVRRKDMRIEERLNKKKILKAAT
jgi:hypothetical protein